jgi:ABC-type multidrug transport system permease subunit
VAVAYREYRIRLTNPIFPMWDVLVPVVYLVVFGASLDAWIGAPGGGVPYPTFFLGGVLAMVAFSIALNSSYTYFEDMQSGIFHELLTYPFPRHDLLLGKFVFNAALGLVGALACLLAGRLALGVAVSAAATAALLGWTLVATAGWYFLCSWISLKVRGFNAYHTTTSTLYLLLMFVSNLFYPTSELPGWIRWAAWANPVTWQVDLMRSATYGAGEPLQVALEAAGSVAFAAAAYALSSRSLNAPVE